MARAAQSYADAVTTTTTQYLHAVEECLDALPTVVHTYESDRFEEQVCLVSDHESACDDHLRTLRRLCGQATPNFTGVYLNAGAVMELYALVDAVPNAAERFVRDLAAKRPQLSTGVADDLAEMATLSARVTGLLTDAIEAYVEALVTEGRAPDPRGEVDLIADLEHRADAMKHGVVERAFADGATPEAIVVRELADALDATLDAAEDAADHLLFMHGAATQP